jgi:pyridoxamine 5'-phosphate oxidase
VVSNGSDAGPRPDLAAMRQSYSLAGLAEGDLAADWVTQFRTWLDDAVDAGLPEPNAMVVATASPVGEVASRCVLCKGVDEAGVVFYTNLTSDKSRDLQANPRAAATFPWIGLQRQVHFRGPVVRVSDGTAQEYWASRPRWSRIGAWASPQSSVLPDRAALEALQASAQERFADTDESAPIPLPPFWGGWRIEPETVEFWQGRYARLHDRLRYRAVPSRTAPDGRSWVIERLAP